MRKPTVAQMRGLLERPLRAPGRTIKVKYVLALSLIILLTTFGIQYAIAYYTASQTGNVPTTNPPFRDLSFNLCPILNVNNALMTEVTSNQSCPDLPAGATPAGQISFTPNHVTSPTVGFTMASGSTQCPSPNQCGGLTINLVFLSTVPCPGSNQSPWVSGTLPTGAQPDTITPNSQLLQPALAGGVTYVYCIYYSSATLLAQGTLTFNYGASVP